MITVSGGWSSRQPASCSPGSRTRNRSDRRPLFARPSSAGDRGRGAGVEASQRLAPGHRLLQGSGLGLRQGIVVDHGLGSRCSGNSRAVWRPRRLPWMECCNCGANRPEKDKGSGEHHGEKRIAGSGRCHRTTDRRESAVPERAPVSKRGARDR